MHMKIRTESHRHESLPRRGAIGKALLVWIFSGSLGLAIIALIAFGAIGC